MLMWLDGQECEGHVALATLCEEQVSQNPVESKAKSDAATRGVEEATLPSKRKHIQEGAMGEAETAGQQTTVARV